MLPGRSSRDPRSSMEDTADMGRRARWLLLSIIRRVEGYYAFLFAMSPRLTSRPRWYQQCAFRSWKLYWLAKKEYREEMPIDPGTLSTPFGLSCHSMYIVFKGAFRSTALGALCALRTTSLTNCFIVRAFIADAAWVWLQSLKNSGNIKREVNSCIRFVSKCIGHTNALERHFRSTPLSSDLCFQSDFHSSVF